MLTITPKDFTTKMQAEGFEVEEDSVIEETHYLVITHPDEEGIFIAVTVCENQVEEVERIVEGGPELDLIAGSPSVFDEKFTPEQQEHLKEIYFGKFLDDSDSAESFEDILALVKENLKVRTEL